MPGTETNEQKRQPEALSATKAEQRLGSRDGRPATNHSSSSRNSRALLTNSRGNGARKGIASPRITITPKSSKLGTEPPKNTPRDFPSVTDVKDDSALTRTENGNSRSDDQQLEGNGSLGISVDQQEDYILEEDELFMTLTEGERNEWETMMTNRSNQLEENLTNHKTWSENFTKRRMFAYCRMRKIIAGYTDRAKFLSDLTSSLNRISSEKSTQGLKGSVIRKQDSDIIFSPRKQKSSKSASSPSLAQSNKALGLMPSVPEDSTSSPSSAADSNLVS